MAKKGNFSEVTPLSCQLVGIELYVQVHIINAKFLVNRVCMRSRVYLHLTVSA